MGRALPDQDITHYNEVVAALGESIRVMTEIDLAIQQHGGWSAAFQTTAAPAVRNSN
jgi:hypothetical protein